MVEFDNSPDRRGQTAVSGVEDMKYALSSALLNWRNDVDRAQHGLQYAGGHLLAMDRGRLWWSYEFTMEVTITDDDGFQPPSEDLVAIRVDLTIANEPLPEPARGLSK